MSLSQTEIETLKRKREDLIKQIEGVPADDDKMGKLVNVVRQITETLNSEERASVFVSNEYARTFGSLGLQTLFSLLQSNIPGKAVTFFSGLFKR